MKGKIFLFTFMKNLLCTKKNYVDDFNIDLEYKALVEKDKKRYEKKMRKIKRKYIDAKTITNDERKFTSPLFFASGDIVITNGTSFFGVAGHTGLFVSPTEILHISSYFNHPEIITISEWVNRYNKDALDYSDVYRPDYYITYGSNASKWARKTYENSKANYSLILDRTSTNPIYCSLIPWQGYKYGVGNFAVNSKSNYGIITPYSLRNEIVNNKYIGSLQ